jgi:hypothetical protein
MSAAKQFAKAEGRRNLATPHDLFPVPVAVL